MDIHAARWSLVFLGLLALAAAASNDYDDYESEDAPPPPDPVKPFRASPLLRQARGSVIGRPGAKPTVTQKTTTTEPPQPEYEDELGEEEIEGEEEQPTTTTEAPKRGGLKTGVVRPFRSNADLIETLKKRRQQHQSGGGAPSGITSTTAQPTSEKSFKSNRRGSNSNKISNAAADQTGSNSERKSTVNGRRFNARSGGSNQPEEEVESEAEEQPTRSRQFGRGRRF